MKMLKLRLVFTKTIEGYKAQGELQNLRYTLLDKYPHGAELFITDYLSSDSLPEHTYHENISAAIGILYTYLER